MSRIDLHRRAMPLAVLCLFAGGFAVGCVSDAALVSVGAPSPAELGPGTADASPVWADAMPIIARRCAACHAEGGAAGLPLATWEQVHAARDVVGYAVDSGRMPPWPAAPGDFAFVGDPTLSEAELVVLRAWIDADAPLGPVVGEPPQIAPPEPARLPRVDAVLAPPEPYALTGAADDYRCLVVAADSPLAGWIRGIRFAIDGAAVHHATLAAIPADDGGAALEALDGADPAPGFDCNGKEGSLGERSQIATWLPGDGPLLLPEGTGIALDAGVRYLLTVHYAASQPGTLDLSAVELMLEREVEREVGLHRVIDPAWKAGGFEVPSGEIVEHVSRSVPIGQTFGGPVEVLSVALHMHKLGRSGRVRLFDGTRAATLLDIPRWDFDWQLAYRLVEPVRLGADARIELTCEHDNTAGTEDILWGEGTDDEMCGAIAYVVPAR